MARRRPIAGHRNRPTAGAPDPTSPTRPPAAPGSEPRPRATAVLERPAPPAAEPAPGDPHDGSRPRRPVRADLVLLVALLLLLALAATAALLAVRARAENRAEQARAEAQAAAERHAVTLLSYDHRHLDRDFARAREVVTGRFAEDYATTTERVVRPSAEEVKAVVTAQVASSAVVRASENRVVVLLFVDQTTTSTRLDGPKVDLNRVRMTLDNRGGEWLVSGVDAL